MDNFYKSFEYLYKDRCERFVRISRNFKKYVGTVDLICCHDYLIKVDTQDSGLFVCIENK